ncbi:MAG: class I SAM-dependent methyltransferase [Verrucomicrobiae bacterium]|nr:class I SAM-dependent methyltransferase [Verrucomicrobiae bacterium]
MVPEKADVKTFWEHIHRYRFAVPLVKGKRVLDIACGEGYGAAALVAAGAASVTAVDNSAAACAHAARRYGLKTLVGDAQQIPLADASVEVVVSFETIEHLPDPGRFLAECFRVLAPGGTLVISTPNRIVYHELVPANPYHVQELDRAEFAALLGARFGAIALYTQCPRTAAWWVPRALAAGRSFWHMQHGLGPVRRLLQKLLLGDTLSAAALAAARENPVAAILQPPRPLAQLADPYAIRPECLAARETPVYFVAVARRS